MSRYFIGLGGNVGDTPARFHAAVERLAHRGFNVLQVSSVYRTRAVGEHAGDDFYNAAVELESSLEPLDVLDVLLDVETELGRERTLHWGPRTIDLDLILCDRVVVQHSRLVLPHPHCWYRRFVLDPLCEIARDAWHSQEQATVAELRDRLLLRPFRLQLQGLDPADRFDVERIIAQFPEVTIVLDRPATLTLNFGGSAAYGRTIVIENAKDHAYRGVLDVLTAAISEPRRLEDESLPA